MKKAIENPILKVLGVVLIAALMAAEVVLEQARQLRSFYSLDTPNPAASYFETDSCRWNMLDEAVSVAETFMGEGTRFQKLQKLNEKFSPENSNSRYQIFTADGKLFGNNCRQDETYGITQKFQIAYKDGSAYITDDPDEVILTVAIAVIDPITVNDRYMPSYSEFRKLSQPLFQGWVSVRMMEGIAGVLILALLFYECSAAGHQRGTEGITLLWPDRIPYEFVLLALVLLLRWWDGRDITPVRAGIFGICFSIFVITTASRVKANSFFSGTLLSRLIHLLQIGNTGLNILAMMCLLMEYAQTFYMRDLFGTEGVLLMIAADAILTYVLLMMLYGNKVIADAAGHLAAGDMEYRIHDAQKKNLLGSLHQQAEALNSIGDGMKIAVRDQMKAERMQAALITNVSHDLKTPLTSIISYTDLLQKDHTPEQEKDYLDALSRQSARLKRLCEDIVEASKASSGMIEADLREVSLKELAEQAAAEYQEKLQKAEIALIMDLKPENPIIRADGRLLWRVLSNLLSNVVKYAQPGTRAYFSSREEEPGKITISLKNTSREQLNIEPEELMERFVRGDNSRHSEGSGLGLSIARSLTETMGGTFRLGIQGDLFEAVITLPEAERKQDEPQA